MIHAGSNWRMLACGLVLVLAGGCIGMERVGEPFGRLPDVDSENERVGRTVFNQYCTQCHPQGEGGLAPALNNKPAPQAVMALQVRKGLGAMPAFPEEVISDAELDALTDYLVALRHAARR